MTDILVVINPTHDDSLDLAAAELIGAASEIGTPVALTVTADHADELASLGASRVLVAPGASLVDATVAAFDLLYPAAVVFGHSVRGRETAPVSPRAPARPCSPMSSVCAATPRALWQITPTSVGPTPPLVRRRIRRRW